MTQFKCITSENNHNDVCNNASDPLSFPNIVLRFRNVDIKVKSTYQKQEIFLISYLERKILKNIWVKTNKYQESKQQLFAYPYKV